MSRAGPACAAVGARSPEAWKRQQQTGPERGAQGELTGARAGAPDRGFVGRWQKPPERAPAGRGRQPVPRHPSCPLRGPPLARGHHLSPCPGNRGGAVQRVPRAHQTGQERPHQARGRGLQLLRGRASGARSPHDREHTQAFFHEPPSPHRQSSLTPLPGEPSTPPTPAHARQTHRPPPGSTAAGPAADPRLGWSLRGKLLPFVHWRENCLQLICV